MRFVFGNLRMSKYKNVITEGYIEADFWKSMFRFNSSSGADVMTGWANVLFPYFQDSDESLYRNPYLDDWRQRLEIDDKQTWRERGDDPQGIGLASIPSCFTNVPLKVHWGDVETEMRLVGGLLGVSQNEETQEVEPECGWVVIYDEPVDPLSKYYKRLDDLKNL